MPASMQNRQHAVAFIVILVLIESIGFGFVVTQPARIRSDCEEPGKSPA